MALEHRIHGLHCEVRVRRVVYPLRSRCALAREGQCRGGLSRGGLREEEVAHHGTRFVDLVARRIVVARGHVESIPDGDAVPGCDPRSLGHVILDELIGDGRGVLLRQAEQRQCAER